jgi:hypothetical protein
VIFIFPDWGVLAEDLHQPSSPDFTIHNLHHEAVAFSLTTELVNRSKQFFREEKMGTLLSHGYVPLFGVQRTLDQNTAFVKPKPYTQHHDYHP